MKWWLRMAMICSTQQSSLYSMQLRCCSRLLYRQLILHGNQWICRYQDALKGAGQASIATGAEFPQASQIISFNLKSKHEGLITISLTDLVWIGW